MIELGQVRRIELAQRGVGRRHQPAALGQANADVSRRSESEPTGKERESDLADLIARACLVAHDRFLYRVMDKARVKKSRPPKLPDLSAICNSPPFRPIVRMSGTPGAISGPSRNAETPSRSTAAPDVSPPATTSLRTPKSTSPDAISASACSIA